MVCRLRACQGRTAASLLATVLLATGAAAQLRPSPGPALALHVSVPPSAVLTDGLHHLLYELHLENRGDVAVTLLRLEIHTDSTTRATLEGDAFIRALDTPADREAPLALAPGQRRVLYLALGEENPSRVIRHLIRTTTPGVEGMLEVPVDRTPPVVLGAPLAGGPWAAVYHSDWERGHRRVFYTVDGVTRLPGRYTIDFVKLDAAGRTARGDVDVVEHSLGYGADVLAVSDGTVAALRDGMPEAARVSARVKHSQEDAAGNFISLDLGNGRFAVYEHLKPGSLRVRRGARVRRGEVVGQVGFSGDSTGPHLHLHVGDAASPLAAEGRPFVFSRFDVLGRYPDISVMGKAPWEPGGAGRRQNERPGANVIVDFGPRPPSRFD